MLAHQLFGGCPMQINVLDGFEWLLFRMGPVAIPKLSRRFKSSSALPKILQWWFLTALPYQNSDFWIEKHVWNLSHNLTNKEWRAWGWRPWIKETLALKACRTSILEFSRRRPLLTKRLQRGSQKLPRIPDWLSKLFEAAHPMFCSAARINQLCLQILVFKDILRAQAKRALRD